MRFQAVLSFLSLMAPALAMTVEIEARSPEAVPQPITPAPEKRTWWTGPSACDDQDKKDHCFQIGHDCNEYCVCIPKEKCSYYDKFKCIFFAHGQFNKDTCECHVPTGGGGYPHWPKRRTDFLCANGMISCPIDPKSPNGRYECLDAQSSVDSCGGCSTIGTGVDCGALPNVMDVSCEAGSCLVHSCERGYKVENGTSCVEDIEGSTKGFVIGALKGAEKFWGL